MNDHTRPSGDEGPGSSDAARRDYVPGVASDESAPGGSEEVARMLIESFPPVQPDESVWTRISAAISAIGSGDADTSPGVINLESRRSRLLPALFSIAAVLIAIVGSVAILNGVNNDGSAVVAAPAYELVDPSTGAITMTITTGDDGTAYATSVGLDVLDSDSTYQLWSVVGDEIVSVGLLGPEPGTVPLRIEGDPAVLALTVEVAGGVAVSEATPVAVWQASS
ncbi:MAG TPA: anti-sigma factor [Acidimicrobiia bacterium]|nr:anti-sigma factor [Acidimicrobiia bacterium]